MDRKVLSWLKKNISLIRKRTAPSPLARKIGRVFQILMLLILCTFVFWRALLYRDVNSRLAQIRAGGFPASGTELNVWCHRVPDTENGALVLTQAFALRHTFPDVRSNEVMEIKLPGKTNNWSPNTVGLVEAYVQTNALALAKVQEALRFSRFSFPVDFSYGPDSQLPHLAGLKEMARIAALQNALDVQGGHPEEWAERVELQLRLAGTLDGEPILISHLVRNSIISMAVKTTERSLNGVTPHEEACQHLQTAFTHAGATNLLPAALAGERAMLIPIFRMSWKEIQSSGQGDGPENQPRKPQRYSGKPATLLWLTGFLERDLDFFLGRMLQSISLAALPPPENLAMTNNLDMANTIAQKRAYFYSSLLLPSFSRIAVREASTQAVIRLTITALAVERFRLANNRLPESLGELTPKFLEAVPIDPFDGTPLRYRRVGSGFIVYSVDADGHDDDGRQAPERKKLEDKTSYDLTFTVER
jgi:hypothetical protein